MRRLRMRTLHGSPERVRSLLAKEHLKAFASRLAQAFVSVAVREFQEENTGREAFFAGVRNCRYSGQPLVRRQRSELEKERPFSSARS